ncbi:MAG: hypothetical protein A2X49_08580 [Lentisphaerae bacterium GWF2_52_8]|nr:MAG: hypothetical protein A2X49_08580 [Lentisphaerae bacterium GWF2_52_8]
MSSNKYRASRLFELLINTIKLLFNRMASWVETYAFSPNNLRTAMFWLAAFVTGLVSVGYASAFRWGETYFYSVIEKNHFLIWIFPPVCFFASWFLIRKVSPEAGGSGIPQVLAANDLTQKHHNVAVHRLLSLKTGLVKIASSLICLLGGGAIGREGPTLQISAAIFHFFGRLTRRFNTSQNLRPWIVTGAAAGLASAFNTPLGGIVYAIEELGMANFERLKIPLFAAIIVAGLVSQWLLGSYLYLGFPKLLSPDLSFLPLAVLIGVAGGLLGAIFAKILVYSVQKLKSIKRVSVAAGFALGSGLLMALLIFLDHRAAGTGRDVIADLLFNGQTASPGLFLVRFASTVVSYLSGAAAGIFAPSLAIGATLGSIVANWVDSPHANLMVLLGMIAFLTGVTRTPFTAFVLVLEMTDRHSAIFPMMLAAMAASSSAFLIDKRSFYEIMRQRLVSEAMESDAPPQKNAVSKAQKPKHDDHNKDQSSIENPESHLSH